MSKIDEAINYHLKLREKGTKYQKYFDVLVDESSGHLPKKGCNHFRGPMHSIINNIEPDAIKKASDYFIMVNEDIAIRPSVIYDVTGFAYYEIFSSLTQQTRAILSKDVQYPDGSISSYGLLLLATMFPECGKFEFLLAEYNRLIEYIVNEDEIVNVYSASVYQPDTIPNWSKAWNNMKMKILNNDPEYDDITAMKFYQVMNLFFRSITKPNDTDYDAIAFDAQNGNCPSFKAQKITEIYPNFPDFDPKKQTKYENDEFVRSRFVSVIDSRYSNGKGKVTPKVLVLMKALGIIPDRLYLQAMSDLRLWHYWRPIGGGNVNRYTY